MKEAVEQRGVQISRFHCDNSAGIIDFPQWRQDLVRAGISLYGMYPSDEVEKDAVQLKPALRLVSHVSFVKEVAKGVSISYGGTFTAEKNLKVATILSDMGTDMPEDFPIRQMCSFMENGRGSWEGSAWISLWQM